jgi:hypothetical protein
MGPGGAAWYEHNIGIIVNQMSTVEGRKLNLWFKLINQEPNPYTDLNTAGVSEGSENVWFVLNELFGTCGSDRVFPASGVYRYGRGYAQEPGQHDEGTQLGWNPQVIVTGMMMLQSGGTWSGEISLTGPRLGSCVFSSLQFFYDDVWNIGDETSGSTCKEVYQDIVRQVAGVVE